MGKQKDFHSDKAASVVNGGWQEDVALIEKITVKRAAGFIMQLKQFLSECQFPYHRKIIFSPTCAVFSRSGANFNVLNCFFNGIF